MFAASSGHRPSVMMRPSYHGSMRGRGGGGGGGGGGHDRMQTSESSNRPTMMEFPMMMPMPFTTVIHSQWMKGMTQLQNLMSGIQKNNPLLQMAGAMSPCGGGGGGGGGGMIQMPKFDFQGIFNSLNPLNLMQNLQKMMNPGGGGGSMMGGGGGGGGGGCHGGKNSHLMTFISF